MGLGLVRWVHLKWSRVNTVIRAGHEVFHVMYALLIRSKITDFVGKSARPVVIKSDFSEEGERSEPSELFRFLPTDVVVSKVIAVGGSNYYFY